MLSTSSGFGGRPFYSVTGLSQKRSFRIHVRLRAAFIMIFDDICLGLDIVISFNTAIQVDDDGSRPDALLRDRLPGWDM